MDSLHYERIPYENGYLPVYYILPDSPKSTIVIHGGYDSFVQEFLDVILYFGDLGYAVYFFEGPDQGEVLLRCGTKMTPEWEHCTSAVLDYYGLDDVTLVGISLGGYLATRASAYEKRISRLVMYDLIYDFYGSLTVKMRKRKARLFDYLTEHPNHFLWKWLLGQGYFIFENGFEQTSVRMILEKVGGEVGMFYHYFKSKDALFDVVIDTFFRQYAKRFEEMVATCISVEDYLTGFLSLYEDSMEKYHKIKGNMHWTIQYAMHQRTLLSLIPIVKNALTRFGYTGKYPLEIAAWKIIADCSVALHAASFQTMNQKAQKALLYSLIEETIS